jgi:hypothetical protein
MAGAWRLELQTYGFGECFIENQDESELNFLTIYQ